MLSLSLSAIAITITVIQGIVCKMDLNGVLMGIRVHKQDLRCTIPKGWCKAR